MAIEAIGKLLLLTLIVMKIVYKNISKFTLASLLNCLHTNRSGLMRMQSKEATRVSDDVIEQ